MDRYIPKQLLECIILFADNVFSVKSWCKGKFGLEDSAIDRQFGIPEEFDYIS